MPCPDEGTAAAFVEGRLSADQRRQLELHLADCDACRVWMAELVRDDAGVAVAHPADAEPMAGIELGRYRIAQRLGLGASGLVYRARDTLLGRDVAIKIHAAGDVSPAARELLLDEARCLARLAHPNVVSVFDAGLAGDEVYLAMELIDGTTLGEWRRSGPRGWREIAMVGAGVARGLAAAHAVGLIHCDVKPDNIMLGSDGRARIADFGLAHERDGETPVRGGTPGYVAPEVLAGEPVSEKSDQYALCRTLEATSRGISAPHALRAILQRGLEVDPDRRFANMNELAEALERVGKRRKRRAMAVAGVVAVALVAGGVVFGVIARPASSPPDCDQIAQRADRLSHDVAAAAQRGLGPAFGTLMDAYVDRWRTERTQLCRAGETDFRRVACLEDAFTQADAVMALLGESDPDIARSATESVYYLPRLDRCVSAASISLPPAPPPTGGGIAIGVQKQILARAIALAMTGRYAESASLAKQCAAAAEVIGYAPLEAAALLQQGSVDMRLGKLSSARDHLRHATEIADRAGDDLTRAHALISLLTLEGSWGHDVAAELEIVREARAVTDRLDNPLVTAELLQAEAMSYLRRGQNTEARPRLEQAIATWKQQLPGDHPFLCAALQNLGAAIQGTSSDPAAARAAEPYIAGAYQMAARMFGAHHPRTASAHGAWAQNLFITGRDAEALPELEAARSDLEAAFGRTHPEVVLAVSSLCELFLRSPRLDDADHTCVEALAIAREQYGEQDPQTTWQLLLVGRLHELHQRHADAVQVLDRALQMFPADGDPLERAEIQFYLARALRELGRTPNRWRGLARAARSAYAGAPSRRADLGEIARWLGPDVPTEEKKRDR